MLRYAKGNVHVEKNRVAKDFSKKKNILYKERLTNLTKTQNKFIDSKLKPNKYASIFHTYVPHKNTQNKQKHTLFSVLFPCIEFQPNSNTAQE